MLDHIRAHSIMVAKAALFLARHLAVTNQDLSLPKIAAGALLHDIGKTRAITTGEDHAELGRQMCLACRFEEIADIVGEHVRLRSFELDGSFTEMEIVYYADKRVNHDRIVNLNDRLNYVVERYGKADVRRSAAILSNFQRCRLVEAKLFKDLDFDPENLIQQIAADPADPFAAAFGSAVDKDAI